MAVTRTTSKSKTTGGSGGSSSSTRYINGRKVDSHGVQSSQYSSQSKTTTEVETETSRSLAERMPFSSLMNVPVFTLLFFNLLLSAVIISWWANEDLFRPLDSDGNHQLYVEYFQSDLNDLQLDYEIVELGNRSLNDVFSVDYKTTDIDNLNDQSLNDVFIASNILPIFIDANNNEVADGYGKTAGSNASFDDVLRVQTLTFNTAYIGLSRGGVTTIVGNVYYNLFSLVDIIGSSGGYYIYLNSNASSQFMFPYNYTLPYKSNKFTSSGISTYWDSYGTVNIKSISFTTPYLINMTLLGISSLTVDEMDDYYDAFISEDILLEAFNDYNDLSLTQNELDDYYDLYLSIQDDNIEIPRALGTIDFRNPRVNVDDEVIFQDYYFDDPQNNYLLGNPILSGFSMIESVIDTMTGIVEILQDVGTWIQSLISGELFDGWFGGIF